MRTTITLAMLASTLALPTIAQQNLYELTAAKSGKLTAVKSSYAIELETNKAYDKFIISVSGDGGYSHQYESHTGKLDISNMNLPYDGSYNYEIRAIKHIAEVRDTMNNGRAADAVGQINIVDVNAGKFTTQGNAMVVVKDIKEPKPGLAIKKDTSHEHK